MKGQKLNPLSHPKGVKLTCELCGKPAEIQCARCRVTYYCSKEHQKLDYDGIHSKICLSLVTLRTPPTFLGSEEDRKEREDELRLRKSALLDLTKTEASKLLHRKEYELAIPAALQALRFSTDVYGPNSIELVPSYLLLGESSIGLRRYAQAEEYLSLAKWAVLKQTNCSNLVKASLARNFGKLYASQGKHDLALTQLANDVYFRSLEVGTHHTLTSSGYFLMGEVFLTKGDTDNALAMFDKVISIWSEFFDRNYSSEIPDANKQALDPAQEAEALHILKTVLEVHARLLGEEHSRTAQATYLVGVLYQYLEDDARALEFIRRGVEALTLCLGAEHPQVRAAAAMQALAVSSARPLSSGGLGGASLPPIGQK
eukprot:GCRY01003043.1.p1 GENE.GCRY01003043.1~~GCRY01003043.1.p1  ORF type:complete len:372 (+),score=89.21 GCRY01003043.1:143-1258(+)